MLFVINDFDDFDVCYHRLNVDGVITDYPRKLQEYLLKGQSEVSQPSNSEKKPIIERQKSS